MLILESRKDRALKKFKGFRTVPSVRKTRHAGEFLPLKEPHTDAGKNRM